MYVEKETEGPLGSLGGRGERTRLSICSSRSPHARVGERLALNCYSAGETFLDQSGGRADQFLKELAFTIPLALRLAGQAPCASG